MQQRRQQEYKKKDVAKGTEKRIESTTKLRKEQREKVISAKRTKLDQDEDAIEYTPEQLSNCLQDLRSQSKPKRLEGLRFLRKLLCSANPPIDQAIDPVILNSLVEFLQDTSDESNQLDAAWCFTNIASGTRDQTEKSLLAAPYLIQHVSGSNELLQEQCAWALGNMAGDCVQFRDVIRANGAIPPIVALLNHKNPSVVRTAAFALANLARGQDPRLGEFFAANIAPPLVRQITSSLENVVIEVAWLMTYLTAGSEQFSKKLVDEGLLPHISKLLQSQEISLIIPILRIVGNIVRSDQLTDLILSPLVDPPLLPTLLQLLDHPHRAIKKEAAYAVSNIAAGPPHHVDQLIRNNFMPKLTNLLRNSQFDIQKEVAYALSNLTTDGRYISAIVEAGVVPSFLTLLRTPDSEVAMLALNFIEMVLSLHPKGPQIIEKADGIDALESLQFHENQSLFNLANKLVDEYFGENYCGDDTNTNNNIDSVNNASYPPWRGQPQQFSF